ncbi:hypothetical protein U1701_09015 [Sphingomonas sp. PB2P19]|uniref:hypothetical protein n=1 Tax=Sphingomonas rhamnosi TaxID=3096156 RepID=UPI002FCB1453
MMIMMYEIAIVLAARRRAVRAITRDTSLRIDRLQFWQDLAFGRPSDEKHNEAAAGGVVHRSAL